MRKKTPSPASQPAPSPSKAAKARTTAPKPAEPPAPLTFEAPDGTKVTGKMARLVDVLSRPGGATITDLCNATGWQKHSVRGAIAGALKKVGYAIASEKPADIRLYRIVPPSPRKPSKAKKAPVGGPR